MMKRTTHLSLIYNVLIYFLFLGYYYIQLRQIHENPVDKIVFSVMNLELLGQCLDVGLIVMGGLLIINFVLFRWIFHLKRSFLKAIGIFFVQLVIFYGFQAYFIQVGNALWETL